MKLTSFEIKGLYGRRNYNLKFNDNRLILVGENGAGKTLPKKNGGFHSEVEIIFDKIIFNQTQISTIKNT